MKDKVREWAATTTYWEITQFINPKHSGGNVMHGVFCIRSLLSRVLKHVDVFNFLNKFFKVLPTCDGERLI